MQKLAKEATQSFPDNYNEKFNKFLNLKKRGKTEFQLFIEQMENDISEYTIDIVRKKYGFDEEWSYDMILDLINNLIDELLEWEEPESTDNSQAEESFEAEENPITKPHTTENIKYPKRYKTIHNDIIIRMIELYEDNNLNKAKELVDDLLKAAKSVKMGKEKPDSLKKYNFRKWKTNDFLVLHNELKPLLSEDEIERQRVRYRSKLAQKDIKAEENDKPLDVNDMRLMVTGVDGKILELELLGGKFAQAGDYDERAVMHFLTKNNLVISDRLKNKIKNERTYQKLCTELANGIFPIIELARGYEKNRTEWKREIIMKQISEKKQKFLDSAPINKTLAKKCLIDCLYRFAILTANPQVEPGNPKPPEESNVFQEALNRLHEGLASKLRGSGYIKDKADLKFFSAIGTPLDLGASCDAMFAYKDNKGVEHVIPVDITANKEKVLAGPKYGEVFLYYNYPRKKVEELDPANRSDRYSYRLEIKGGLNKAIKLFVERVFKKINNKTEKDYNYSDGLLELLEKRNEFLSVYGKNKEAESGSINSGTQGTKMENKRKAT